MLAGQVQRLDDLSERLRRGLVHRTEIARGALASQYISVIPIREQGIELEVGAIMRSNAVLSPVLRQLTTHLHRAAHHVQKDLPPA